MEWNKCAQINLSKLVERPINNSEKLVYMYLQQDARLWYKKNPQTLGYSGITDFLIELHQKKNLH